MDIAHTEVEKVRTFETEINKVKTTGNVVKTTNIRNQSDGARGIEIFLDMRVSQSQIRHIVHYIVKHYNFDAYFYTKTHSIKVWYRNAK